MTARRIFRVTARCLIALLSLSWGGVPLLAQDASDAATQQYMQQRLQALQAQDQQYQQQLNAAQSDPGRAQYLQALLSENQSLEARYTARLNGQPDPGLSQPVINGGTPPAPAAGGTDPNAAPASASSQGGMSGMLKSLTGGGSTRDLIIQIVAGVGGWYLGKMAFGPLGGIVGGFVAPMLAKWLADKLMPPHDNSGQPTGGAPPVAGMPAIMPNTAQGAPLMPNAGVAAANSASISQAKSQMDAAYVALTQAIQGNRPPAEIAQLRNVYEQWQVAYNQALAGQR